MSSAVDWMWQFYEATGERAGRNVGPEGELVHGADILTAALAEVYSGCVAISAWGRYRAVNGQWVPEVVPVRQLSAVHAAGFSSPDLMGLGGYTVIPQLSGTLTPRLLFGNNTATIRGWRVAFNAIDATDGGERLENGAPGVFTFAPTEIFDSGEENLQPIIRMDIAAITDATAASVGLITYDDVAADIDDLMQTLTFNADQNVLRVRLEPFAMASSNYLLEMKGISYVESIA